MDEIKANKPKTQLCKHKAIYIYFYDLSKWFVGKAFEVNTYMCTYNVDRKCDKMVLHTNYAIENDFNYT
jgi:hypothetical protein